MLSSKEIFLQNC